MPHHEIHASGSLDNSGCKRLRISSLVDDMAEEENIYDLYASAIELLDEMRSRCMDTEHWSNMLKSAFAKEDVNALNKVIGLLQQKLAAHPGGPAAAEPAVPNAHVPASAPPGELGSSRDSTSSFVRPCPFGFIGLIAATYQASSLRQADVRLFL